MAAMQDPFTLASPTSPHPADMAPPAEMAQAPHRFTRPHERAAEHDASTAAADERGSWIEALKQLLKRAEACVVRNFRVPPGGG
ncbi:MAG: hypothetical protein ACOVLH_03615 [Roseateles sp.]